jgi:hypothetical protein
MNGSEKNRPPVFEKYTNLKSSELLAVSTDVFANCPSVNLKITV